MMYTCQKCGSTADSFSSLCSPASEEFESKFCGASTDQVCDDKLKEMKFKCDSCGSVSADAEHLCNPSQIK